MKKIKGLSLLLFGLALIFSLKACMRPSAKSSFLDDIVRLNKYNANANQQEVSLVINHLHSTDSEAKNLNQLSGSKSHFSVDLDRQHKLAKIAGDMNNDKKDYKLDLIAAKSGIYIDSTDIKKLYAENKDLLTSSNDSTEMVLDGMLKGLTKP